jgi:hypothetical protein
MSPDEAPPGNGLLLFFRVDDFNMALKRARALVTQLEKAPHVNPNPQTTEFASSRFRGPSSASPAHFRLLDFKVFLNL